MSMQLELLLATSSPASPTLSDIIHGNCCRVKSSGKILMKLKPTGFLLNSNIVADVLNRGDCFVVDMAKGTLYATSATQAVTPLDSKLQYKVKIVEESGK